MPMTDAFKFLALCRNDDGFRKKLYEFDDPARLRSFLEDEGYSFTNSEIGDALTSLKLKAEDEYEAEEIQELRQWYSMLSRSSAESACAGCHGKRA